MSATEPKIVAVYVIFEANILNPQVLPSIDPHNAPGYIPDTMKFPELVLTESDDDDQEWSYLELPGPIMHRKWAGELSADRWALFADRYCVDLDDDGVPLDYDDTMGSITEHGHIPAIRVDNTEGWGCNVVGSDPVLDSGFYISIR